MEFRVDRAVFERYPMLLIGLLVCKGIVNRASAPKIVALLREAEARVRAKFQDPEALKAHPTIAAWQEVHRAFGSNPNKFPSSIHALCKRVAKGSELPSINTLVDLYNIISLHYMLPVGGEDIDRCKEDIALTIANGTESFTPLGGTENEPPEQGEVIYRDSEGVLCRKFNWRESARTCLTERTTNAVLVVEAVPPTTHTELDAALQELQALAQTHCGGNVGSVILNATHTSEHL